MLSEEAVNHLRSLDNAQLRAIKIRTAEAKGGSYDYRLFCFVDRLLRTREVIRVFRRL